MVLFLVKNVVINVFFFFFLRSNNLVILSIRAIEKVVKPDYFFSEEIKTNIRHKPHARPFGIIN